MPNFILRETLLQNLQFLEMVFIDYYVEITMDNNALFIKDGGVSQLAAVLNQNKNVQKLNA